MWFLWNFCTNNNWKKNLKILFHKCDQSAGKRINKFFLKLIETIICCTSNYPYHSHGWFLLFKVFPFEPHCNSTMMTQLWFSHSLTFFTLNALNFQSPVNLHRVNIHRYFCRSYIYEGGGKVLVHKQQVETTRGFYHTHFYTYCSKF